MLVKSGTDINTSLLCLRIVKKIGRGSGNNWAYSVRCAKHACSLFMLTAAISSLLPIQSKQFQLSMVKHVQIGCQSYGYSHSDFGFIMREVKFNKPFMVFFFIFKLRHDARKMVVQFQLRRKNCSVIDKSHFFFAILYNKIIFICHCQT